MRRLSYRALQGVLTGAHAMAAIDDPTDREDAVRSRRRETLSPERRLQAEMLIQAFADLTPHTRQSLGIFRQNAPLLHMGSAIEWFRSDSREWCTDFLRCCESLEVDPGRVRSLVTACVACGDLPPILRHGMYKSERPRTPKGRGRPPEEMRDAEGLTPSTSGVYPDAKTKASA